MLPGGRRSCRADGVDQPPDGGVGRTWDVATRRGDAREAAVSTGTPPRRSRKSASREEVAMKPSCICCSSTLPWLLRGSESAAGAGTIPGPTEARKTPATLAHMRPAAALTVLSCLLFAAGCGGSDDGATATDPAGGTTLEELWRAPGDDVAVVHANHEPGDVRVSFLVVDAKVAPSRCRPPRSSSPPRSTTHLFWRPRESSSGSACRRRPGGRDPHLRRTPEAAATGQILDARRARGRQREGAGARERRRGEERRATRRGRRGHPVRHSNPGFGWW